MVKGKQTAYILFISPVLLIIALVFVFPILKNFQVSLTNAKFLEKARLIGLSNYLNALTDSRFWHAVAITALYTLLYVSGIFLVGFFTAFLLDKLSEKSRLRSVFRTFFVLPYAIPDVVAATIFLWMLDYQFGILNYLLRVMRIVNNPVFFLGHRFLALVTVIAIEIWRLFPMHTLILFSGMQDVPRELYESAEIDGAGGLVKFFRITIPHLREVSMILLILTIIWCFRRFTMIWILTRGGPDRGTETIVIQIYSYAFNFNKMGYGAALGTILLILTVLLIVPYFLMSRAEKL